MEEKNLQVVLDALAETIRELKFQLSMKDYEIEQLRETIKNKEGNKNAQEF